VRTRGHRHGSHRCRASLGERKLTTIALERRFIEWREGDGTDPETLVRFKSADLPGWDAVCARRRVVLLAEAGSGKTEEMKEQARQRVAAGQFAFYSTVEDVGTDGLEGSLRSVDKARLASWRASTENAWFFIDSADDAKRAGVRLEKVVRRIADGIEGRERRAHIILSCRVTDWQFRRDLRLLIETLPKPKDETAPSPTPPIGASQLLIDTLRRRRQPAAAMQQTEEPFVVLLAPLDADRVRLFALGKGIPDVDAFFAQIDDANLWRFARRPLDLDWLVSFWQTYRRLGSLTEMLEHSLAARVREPDPDRARRSAVDESRALRDLQRVGAALVLGRKATIGIPDAELVLANEEQSLDLSQALPDWSPEDRAHLLSQPVFDPATFGRARLHNDNEGAVRGYLAAQWLRRLRSSSLTRGELFDLLFAASHGIKLVKPSIQETAAWLSIWDKGVGREIARRDPVLLLAAGDPASLTASVRAAVLANVCARLAEDDLHLPLLIDDALKRFARPDLTEAIRSLWSRHEGNDAVRELLLRLIWLGKLDGCADLAEAAAFNPASTRYTRIFAGRAVAAVGHAAAKRRYIEFLKSNSSALPNALFWEAFDHLFPASLYIDDLLEILAKVDVADSDHGLGFTWHGPRLVDRLEARQDLERLLHGLLTQLGDAPQDIGHTPNAREEAYFCAIGAAACRLLERCPANEAPNDAIDAALRLGIGRRYGRSLHEPRDVAAEIHGTAPRRRLAFWWSAEWSSRHPWLRGQSVVSPSQIALFGYPLGLRVEDLEWLLTDAPERDAENERRLAINTAMGIWRESGSPPDVLCRIEASARLDPVMKDTFDAWFRPPPVNQQLRALERETARLQKKAEKERAARDQSWVEFLDGLRSDPDQLRKIPPPTATTVDARLFHLWNLLSETVDSGTRHAIDSVAPVEPVLGRELADRLQEALIRFWRLWKPKLKSEKAVGELNQINLIDCMGLTGVSLEARSNPGWAEQLSCDEAVRAAGYATLEINAFPPWLSELAVAKPAEVLKVFLGEVTAELSDPQPRAFYELLGRLSRADKPVVDLMAPALFAELEKRTDIAPVALNPLLETISRGFENGRDAFATCVIERFQASQDLQLGGLYLVAAFAVDSEAATEALMARLDSLSLASQTALVQLVLPAIFSTGFPRFTSAPPRLSFQDLERLVSLSFRTIRIEDDEHLPRGQAHPVTSRGNAEHARSVAFNQLIETPGRQTFDAILRLADHPDHPIPIARLRQFAEERAAKDSESTPWPPAEVVDFERVAQRAPTSAADLQRLALRHLADIRYDLLHDDFAQGAALQLLPKETLVQTWTADRLRSEHQHLYSVERESQVVDEKEPDIRLRAKTADASMPMEIKVVDDWRLVELEAALTEQLCAKYLRARGARHGILLMVYQGRQKRWRDSKTGASLAFQAVVDRLKAMAEEIATAGSDAPQPKIAVLDVSTLSSKPQQHRSKAKRAGALD
jgi:hypothetical protein